MQAMAAVVPGDKDSRPMVMMGMAQIMQRVTYLSVCSVTAPHRI